MSRSFAFFYAYKHGHVHELSLHHTLAVSVSVGQHVCWQGLPMHVNENYWRNEWREYLFSDQSVNIKK